MSRQQYTLISTVTLRWRLQRELWAAETLPENHGRGSDSRVVAFRQRTTTLIWRSGTASHVDSEWQHIKGLTIHEESHFTLPFDGIGF